VTLLRFALRVCLLVLVICQVALASTNPLTALQDSGRLQIASSFSPGEGLVPGQQVKLTLEVATDRWFTGGTRIGIPEVPGLVILQTEQFASNASEARDGQSWVIQRWTLDVYPQRAGEFTIPPMPLKIKVNAGDAGNLEGELMSSAIQLSVSIPDSLAQAEHWVAAPTYAVSQHFDRPLEDLQVGDAFEREIRFEAEDVMAMMLPAFNAEKLPGLATYPSPPVLDNNNNRGQTRGSRSERISYVVEAEGQYLLPARDYFWWNTTSGQLELLTLPTTEITAGPGGFATTGATILDVPLRQLVTFLLGFMLLAGLVWLASKWLPRLPLAGFTRTLSGLWQQLQALRKPALPERLNPGSNAGE
jgi:hypothetical protein